MRRMSPERFTGSSRPRRFVAVALILSAGLAACGVLDAEPLNFDVEDNPLVLAIERGDTSEVEKLAPGSDPEDLSEALAWSVAYADLGSFDVLVAAGATPSDARVYNLYYSVVLRADERGMSDEAVLRWVDRIDLQGFDPCLPPLLSLYPEAEGQSLESAARLVGLEKSASALADLTAKC